MKLALSVLLIASALIGCSSGSNENGSSDDVFQKNTVPASPAPIAYLQGFLKTMKDSKAIIPIDKAIFNTILKTEEVETVSKADSAEAKKSLNTKGLSFLNSIKTNCVVGNATVDKNRKTISNKETEETMVGAVSTSGAKCPFLFSAKSSVTLNTKNLEISGDGHWAHSRLQTQTHSMEIVDAAMRAASAVKSLKYDLSLSYDMDFRGDSAKGFKGSVSGAANGQAELKLANGDYLKGPITMFITGAIETGSAAGSQPTTMAFQVLFDGVSPQGAVRVVIISKPGEEAEVYLNGQKMSPSDLEALGVDIKK